MDLLEMWLNRLELKDVKTEAIMSEQVVYPKDLKTKEFIGVDIQERIIYHTRPLKEDDIVHELLHIKFPKMSEKNINLLTKLITTKKPKMNE